MTSSMAGIDLTQVPALAPPDGVVPNLIDPYDRSLTYVVVSGVFLAFATVFVVGRLWTRLVIQWLPWWDDLAVVLALLSQAAYCGINIWLCRHGVGRHMWDVSAATMSEVITPARGMADVTEAAIAFTKLSLLLFYYRLFGPNQVTRIGSMVGAAVVAVLYTMLLFLFIFLDISANYTLNKVIAVINVISDFYLLILPLWAVLHLHMVRKKRLGLAALFSSGLFACIMSTVGAYYRFRFATDPDFTWSLFNVVLVNTIEQAVGIFCACLPLLPAAVGPLVAPLATSVRSLRERLLSTHASTTASGRQRPNPRGYYAHADSKKQRATDLERGHNLNSRAFCRGAGASEGSLVGDKQQTWRDDVELYGGHQNAEGGFSRGLAYPQGIQVRRDVNIDCSIEHGHA